MRAVELTLQRLANGLEVRILSPQPIEFVGLW